MSEDRFLELAPLQALGILDGDDLVAFQGHVAGCGACSDELRSHESIASQIALGLDPIRPAPPLRQRILARDAALPPAVVPLSRPPRRWAVGWLTGAAAALAAGLVVVGIQRDVAREAAQAARREAEAAHAEAARATEELLTAQRDLAEVSAFRGLFMRPEVRVAVLGGLAPAPKARAHVVFDPSTREAVLVASGLEKPPSGKTYEAWVIAAGAPIPAGVFAPDAAGRAVLKLPLLDATAGVKTFAVTLEPEGGTLAPTGAMVLAGTVS